MKYTLSTLFLILSFHSVSFAQVPSTALQCDLIMDRQQYNTCCTTNESYAVNRTLCEEARGRLLNEASPFRCTADEVRGSREGYTRCCTGGARSVNELICADADTDQQIQGFPSGTQSPQGTSGATTQPPSPDLPPRSNANTCSNIKFDSLVNVLIWARCIMETVLIPLLFSIAFIVFLWGMVNYIRNADNEKKRQESKNFIYWGILGLTVMVSIWGIVRIVTSTFGIENAVPKLQTDYLKRN